MKVCLNDGCEKPAHSLNRCKRHYDQNRYTEIREIKSVKEKIYRDANKEKIKIYQKQWREKNKKKVLLKDRNNYIKNKKHYDSYRAEWRNKNRLKWNSYRRARDVKKKNNGIFLILDKEFRKLNQQSCFYCGSKEQLTIDHIIPIVRGGRHSIGNILIACKSCNSRKSKKTIMEWRLLH